MIFVKNINFFKNTFIVDCVIFSKHTSFVNDNFSKIFVHCFFDDFCSFLDINVYFANVVADFFDNFNVVYNNDVNDKISRNFMFFIMFRINAFDVKIINERISLIFMNAAFMICFLIHVIFFTSRKYDDRKINMIFIYHNLSYILFHLRFSNLVILQRCFSKKRLNDDRMFILFYSFFLTNYEVLILVLRVNHMYIL